MTSAHNDRWIHMSESAGMRNVVTGEIVSFDEALRRGLQESEIDALRERVKAHEQFMRKLHAAVWPDRQDAYQLGEMLAVIRERFCRGGVG